jgi:hypothetical protein
VVLDPGHLLGARRARRDLRPQAAGRPRHHRVPRRRLRGQVRRLRPRLAPGLHRRRARAQAKAPVALLLDRREEHLCTGNRPDSIQQVTLGATPGRRPHRDQGPRPRQRAASAPAPASVATPSASTRSAPTSASSRTTSSPTPAPPRPSAPPATRRAPSPSSSPSTSSPPSSARTRSTCASPTTSTPSAATSSSSAANSSTGTSAQARADERKRGTRVRHGVGVAASIWGDFGRGKAVVATLSVGRDGSDRGEATACRTSAAASPPSSRRSSPRSSTARSPRSASPSATASSAPPSAAAAATRPRPSPRPCAPRPRPSSSSSRARRASSSGRASPRTCFGTATARTPRQEDELRRAVQEHRRRGDRRHRHRPDTYGAYPMKFMGGNSYQSPACSSRRSRSTPGPAGVRAAGARAARLRPRDEPDDLPLADQRRHHPRHQLRADRAARHGPRAA